MTKQEIISKVKKLKLPKGSYVVFGSCPLAATGIREAGDIDILASRDLFDQLKEAGWPEIDKGKEDKPIGCGAFEIHYKWSFSSYQPTLEHLLTTAMAIDDVPFASLDEVRKWKAASGRPKDLKDIKLIDKYLAENQ